jgi:uncharacterized membrane protein
MTRIPRYVTALIVIGYGAGAAVYPAIPRPLCGPDCEISIGRLLIAYLLPTTALLLYVLLNAVWARDPLRDRDESADRTYRAIMLPIVLLIFVLHATVLMTFATGLRSDVMALFARLVPVALGVALISIGNLLPRVRPNLVIGIRTRRTLADRAVWMTTHRLAGYVTVGCGIVIAAGAIGLAVPVGSRMVLLAGPIALVSIPVLVAYSARKARA